MKTYSILQIGAYHLNHCDDYFVISEIGSDKILCAVMDGCTMAIDSYFASTVVGKILRKISKTKGYKELYGLEAAFSTIDDYLKSILEELFKELNIIKCQLMLEQNELLTTLIILLVDKISNQGIVLVIGDGLVSINGAITEFDQDNKPDYLGFHLAEQFENWYKMQTQKIFINDVNDVSIATDGITMFAKVAENNIEDEIDPIDYLLHDKTGHDSDDMLNLKMKELEHIYGLKPTDDLSVIRFIK